VQASRGAHADPRLDKGPDLPARLRLILSNLDQAESAEHMDLPGLALHQLKGERKGIWAVKVSGNWRVTFRFTDGDADIVHYEDYH